jgi:nucleoid-associated protein YgaU
VLTGPTVINCFSSSDGFGQCVQTRLADVGLLPRPPAPPVVADSEEAVGAVSESVVEPEVAIAEPALDVTPPEAAVAVPENLIAATFGLLRAEPDGSVVIAGSGTPGSEIEVYANGSLLGRATVETSGDWVLVPDAPLPAGPLEITLGEKGKTGQAEQSFVVVINEDKKSQPLVVASTPGQASDILQGLERPETAAVAQIAEATPTTQPEAAPASAEQPQTPAENPAVETAPAQPAEPASAEPSVTATDVPATQPDAPTPVETAEPENAVAATEEPAAPAETTPAPEATPAATPAETPVVPANGVAVAEPVETAEVTQPEAPAEPAAAVEEPAATVPAVQTADAPADAAPATSEPAEEPQTQVAAVEQPTAPTTAETQTAAPATVPPTIDAIEIEGDRTFFAGAGPDGATVRLYVDNAFIADAQVEGGRWLVEAGSVLTKPNQRIRVDLLQRGTATVIGRAEVDFVLELPPGDEPTAVTTAEQASPQATAEAEEPVVAATTPAETPAQTSEPAASATVETLTVPPATTSETAPSATVAETPVTQPAAPEAQAVDAPASQPTSTTSTEVAQPATPAIASAETPAVAQAPAVEAEAAPAIPTMVAVSMGGADAQRFAAGKAIIRRGDNLWTIARRVYGTGMKFTTIYEANTGQIRDPDRIYPGQVFNLPTE